jgi:anion-transporting  ArsA/GET3 family ATPase
VSTKPKPGSTSNAKTQAKTEAREVARQQAELRQLVADQEVIVCTGSGGVGKTTTAAVMALEAAQRGRNACVVTIDPAKRLADALGLAELSNTPTRIEGPWPGQLWALMLDTKSTFDDLVQANAESPEQAEGILANRFYRNISGALSGTQEYMAMEKLYELHQSSDFDVVVVDTPPTRNALDFLDAPQRMADFFSSRLLKWLIVPYRSRLVNAASRPFYQVADRILGTQFLADISEFFVLFQTLHEGFVERAAAVERLLADRRTSFMVVSTLEGVPLREAEFFSEELTNRKLHLGAIVLNKVLPDYLLDPGGAATAERLRDDAAQLAGKLTDAVSGASAAQVERVLAEVGRSYLDYRLVAQRETEQRTELASRPEVLVSIPYFDTDITDVAGLVRLGEQLWGGR